MCLVSTYNRGGRTALYWHDSVGRLQPDARQLKRNESAAWNGAKKTHLTGVFKLSLADGLIYGLLCNSQGHCERLGHAVLWNSKTKWPWMTYYLPKNDKSKHKIRHFCVWSPALICLEFLEMCPLWCHSRHKFPRQIHNNLPRTYWVKQLLHLILKIIHFTAAITASEGSGAAYLEQTGIIEFSKLCMSSDKARRGNKSDRTHAECRTCTTYDTRCCSDNIHTKHFDVLPTSRSELKRINGRKDVFAPSVCL